MHRRGDRILGPYEERAGWRLTVIVGGERTNRLCPSESEARKLKVELEKELKHTSPLTVDEAIDEYMAHMKRLGRSARTLKDHPQRVRRFFEGVLDRPIASLTLKQCAKLYDVAIDSNSQRRTKNPRTLRAATHRTLLRVAKTFLSWAKDEGLLKDNPAAKVKPVGKINKGKPQLRFDEARLWSDHALRLADQGNQGAIAAMTALLLGMRAGEVLARVARDLDFGGRILWIPSGKTDNARRHLEVPAVLQPYLLRLAEGKGAQDLLFDLKVKAKVEWLYRRVRDICSLAGVPRVCTHSLRGLHSTVAIEAGATAHLVAASLGHGSSQITKDHYIRPGTLEGLNQGKILQLLDPSATLPQDPGSASSPSRMLYESRRRGAITPVET